MPRYDYYCNNCGTLVEIVKPMSESDSQEVCSICNFPMRKQFMGQNVGTPNKDYSQPIVSHSLAMCPSQISEHKQHFPDIKVRADGCPIFDNFQQHESYLKKRGIFKDRQSCKSRGTVIKKGQ